jgi:hypothetical protein
MGLQGRSLLGPQAREFCGRFFENRTRHRHAEAPIHLIRVQPPTGRATVAFPTSNLNVNPAQPRRIARDGPESSCVRLLAP